MLTPYQILEVKDTLSSGEQGQAASNTLLMSASDIKNEAFRNGGA